MFLDTQKNGYKLFLITDLLGSGVVPSRTFWVPAMQCQYAVSGYKLFLITDLLDSGVVSSRKFWVPAMPCQYAVSVYKLFLITDLYDLMTLVAAGHM